MPSVSRALQQLARQIEHTGRYLLEYYENSRVEARHGFTEAPEWYLSEEAEDAYHQYGSLLQLAFDRIWSALQDDIPKRLLIKRLKHKLHQLRADLDTKETAPGFLALVSPRHADWEALDVLLDILKGNMYVSKSYGKWNTNRTNRWYHTPYLPDEGALTGIVFWVNPQTRLVLFDDRLQLRWRQGKVLLDIEYANIDTVSEVNRKRQKHWRLKLRDGSEHIVDVSWVHDLSQLRAEMVKRSVKFVSKTMNASQDTNVQIINRHR